MKIPKPIVIDFETKRIEGRPSYPPEPVGVAVKDDEFNECFYAAWGHPTGNNNTLEDAADCLCHVFESDRELLFHNAKFDVAVACEKIGLPVPRWDRVHDTMFLCYLADPHGRADLKGASEDLLDWEPEERDAVAEWLWENRKELHEKYPDQPCISKQTGKPQANKKSTGEWLAYCPADIVAPYAIGDVERTAALFEHLYPLIVKNGMLEAYNRERQVLPIFMENERLGIRVDVEALERDIPIYRKGVETAEKWLQKRLNSPGLNLDANEGLAEALSVNNIVDDDKWVWTKGSKKWRETNGREGKGPVKSVSKDNLRIDMFNDAEVASALGYYNRMSKCISTFLEPWLRQALLTGGTIHTNWNQTRGGDGGTRTGRPSTKDPNLLNLAKDLEDRGDGYSHPVFLKVPQLPLVRNYVLPEEDCVFVHRDFDGQEMRVFAEYERGALYKQYMADPATDPHEWVSELMKERLGREFPRTNVKVTNFRKLYGGGIPALMKALNMERPEASEFFKLHDEFLPGRVVLNEEITKRVRMGSPIVTWGGRLYYVEPPGYRNGKWQTYEYKLLNYLCQGSAADITKEALIRWYNHPRRHPEDRFLVTVYDEINISAPKRRWREAMEVLCEVMESIEMDVPMLSSPKVGLSWGKCQKPAKGESEEDFLTRMESEL